MTVLAVMLYQTTPWEELTKGLIPKLIDDYLMRMRPPLISSCLKNGQSLSSQ